MGKDGDLSAIRGVLKKVSPYLVGHGGGLSLVGWQPRWGRVIIKLSGACAGCPLAGLTVNLYLKKELQKKLAKVKEVVIKEETVE